MNRRTLFVLLVAAMTPIGCAGPRDSVEARNIDVVRLQHSEIWSKGNLDLIDEVYARDFIGHFPGGTVTGHAGVLARVTAHRLAFPDWTEEVEDAIAEGDRVVTRFTSRGTNSGQFLGQPPTNNRVEVSEVCIYKLTDGKIVEQWVFPDMLGMQKQLARQDEE